MENPTCIDNAKYIILNENKQPMHPFKNGEGKSWDEVKNEENIGMIVPPPFVVLDFDTANDARIMMQIVDKLDLHCNVMQTDRGYHFWFRSTEKGLKNYVKGRLAIGIYSDRKVHSKNAYVVIKRRGQMREWLRCYDESEIGILPKWLTPVKCASSSFQFMGMKEGDGRNQSLYEYILYLQTKGWEKDDIIQCLEVINNFVFEESLSPSELRNICRDEAFKSKEELQEIQQEQKGKKETNAGGNGFKFQHDVFAEAMLENYDIISVYGNLYIYKDGYYQFDSSKTMWIEKAMIGMYRGITSSQREQVLKYFKVMTNKTEEIENEHKNPYIINLNNGRLNLLTGQLLCC